MSIAETTLTIAMQLWMSHIVRGFLRGRLRNQLLKDCLLELVAAAEMCGVSYELAFGEYTQNTGIRTMKIFCFFSAPYFIILNS